MHRKLDEQRLVAQAATALGGRALGSCQVIRGDAGVPCHVVRCQLADGAIEGQSTVIVKQSNWPGEAIAEWNALEFMNSLPDLQVDSPVPRLLGVEPEAELVVMEELGRVSLSRVLRGADGSMARHALLALARALAALHGATIGWEERYRVISRRASSRGMPYKIDRHMNDALAAFPSVLESAGTRLGADAARDLEVATGLLNAPEPFRGLLQGDLNPGNLIYDGQSVRLCDFVPSAYYNVLVEGVYPLIYYLAHGDIARYPDDLTEEMLEAYVQALGTRCPAVLDEKVRGRHMTAAGAGWMAYILRALPQYLDRDQGRGVFTYWQSMLHCTDSFSRMASRFGELLHLRDLANELSEALKMKWQCARTVVPLCPAFQLEGTTPALLSLN